MVFAEKDDKIVVKLSKWDCEAQIINYFCQHTAHTQRYSCAYFFSSFVCFFR